MSHNKRRQSRLRRMKHFNVLVNLLAWAEPQDCDILHQLLVTDMRCEPRQCEKAKRPQFPKQQPSGMLTGAVLWHKVRVMTEGCRQVTISKCLRASSWGVHKHLPHSITKWGQSHSHTMHTNIEVENIHCWRPSFCCQRWKIHISYTCESPCSNHHAEVSLGLVSTGMGDQCMGLLCMSPRLLPHYWLNPAWKWM